MAIPTQGILRIYPQTTSIVSGEWSVSGDGSVPSAVATANDLNAYYLTQTSTPANAPRTRYIDPITITGITKYVAAPGSKELEFSPDLSNIAVYNLASVYQQQVDWLSSEFPMGLTINSVRVVFTGSTVNLARSRNMANLNWKYKQAVIKTLALAGNSNILNTVASDNQVPGIASWSIVQAASRFGFEGTFSSIVDINPLVPVLENDLIYIELVYNTLFFSLTLDTPNALPGEIVQISDASSSLGVFNDIKIYWDDPDNFGTLIGGISIPTGLRYTFTSSLWKFQLPTNLGIPYGGRRLMVMGVGDGTLFVGEFPIANLNISLVDGSGVYQLERGKYNDTYYDRSTVPTTTVDLKIPSPGGRTGYF